ncbi:Disease resistance protein L6 [Linum perenne]
MDYLARAATAAVVIAFVKLFLGRRRRKRSSDHSNDDTSSQQSDSTDSRDSDSVPLPIGEYEVFLSFRGPDTRDSITDILYRFLAHSKIRTFRDDDELRKGEGIWSNLVKAISQSKISVTIFSPRYAESKWCLKELAEIVEHKKREKGHIILPIFYKVDPRDVRHQTGPYEVAFQQHERNTNFDEKTIETWKAALNEVGSLKGWHIETKKEEVDVADVVYGVIWSHLSKDNNELETDELVGIDDQVEKVGDMLDLDSQGVKVVGLHGMGGIGKSTLATAVYNKVSACFDRSMLEIGDDNVFLMHDQLRDMGREIVRREDIEHPWMRSRIWSNKEAYELLLNNKGTGKIKAIRLENTRFIGVDFDSEPDVDLESEPDVDLESEPDVDLESTCFTNMSELRYFCGQGVKLIGNFNHLLPNLKWMRLENHYDDDCVDCKATINVKSLNILDVKGSGYDFMHMKEANKLKVLILGDGLKMSKLPEFPKSGSLEILDIKFSNKEEDLKIEKLRNLKMLKLEGRIGKIKGGTIGMMKELRELNLCGISCDYNTFRQTIADIEELSLLQVLNVASDYLKDVLEGIKLPNSLKKLHTSSGFANVEELLELEEFTIFNGTEIVIRPAAASSRGGDTSSTIIPWIHSSKLKSMELHYMKRIIMVESKDITMLPSSLTELTICRVDSELILNLKNLRNLTDLKIQKCPNLEEVRGMGGLKSLQFLLIVRMKKLTGVHGLGNLMSCSSCKLTWLYIDDCPLLRDVVTFEQQDDDDDGGGSEGERERYVLVQIESLVTMRIWESPSVDWRSIPRLSKFPMLKELTIKNIGLNINEESASKQGQHQQLERLENLQELVKLYISNVELKRILNLKNLGNLTELKLRECPNLEEVQGMEGLKSLKVLLIVGAQKLTRIHGLGNLMSSSSCKLTTVEIRKCPLLREIVTFEKKDDDDGGSDGERERYLLVQIESLITMKIEDSSSIDWRSIPRLSKFPMLEELTIKNIGLNINEESASQQGQHQQLEGLVDLSISNVDSKQILNLKNLGNLTTLHLEGCHNLEEVQGMEGLKSLQILKIEGARKLTCIHGLGNLMSCSSCELTELVIRECPLLREVETLEQQDDDDDDDGGSHGDDFLLKMKILEIPSIDFSISSIDGRSTTPMLSKLPMFKYMKFSEYRMAMKGIDKLRKRLSYLRLEDLPALQEIVGAGGYFKLLWGLMNECFSFEIKDLPYSSLHRIEFDRRRNTLFEFIEYDFDLSSLSTEGGNLGELRFAITWPCGGMYDMSDAESNPDLSSSISSMEVVEAPEHGLLERVCALSLAE